jgi:AbrB family looped-hinge helix DNA binding protein
MARKPRAVREPAASYESRIDANGRIVLPAPVRHRLGVSPGDEVVLRVEPDGVRVTTVAAAVREAQAMVRRHAGRRGSLVDDLLKWRRAEARRG